MPGGSSSASGVSVAARLTPCAIGSDTGGSTRLPAAFNGVVGFKPSDGRIPKAGILALASTFDTIGPLARSVADCALVEAALRGAPGPTVRRLPLCHLDVLAPTNFVTENAEPAVIENHELVLEALAVAGTSIRREPVPALDIMAEAIKAHGPLIAAEAYHETRAYVDGEAMSRIDRRVMHRLLQGKAMNALSLLTLQRTRQILVTELRAQMGAALLSMPKRFYPRPLGVRQHIAIHRQRGSHPPTIVNPHRH